MNKQHFDQLVKGVREMKRHMTGKSVRGARTSELTEPDIRHEVGLIALDRDPVSPLVAALFEACRGMGK